MQPARAKDTLLVSARSQSQKYLHLYHHINTNDDDDDTDKVYYNNYPHTSLYEEVHP